MSQTEQDLEQLIASALEQRAEQLPSPTALPAIVTRTGPRRWTKPLVASGVAALTTAVVVGAFVVARSGGTPARKDAARGPRAPATSSTEVAPPPPGVAGTRVPLTRADDDEDVQFILHTSMKLAAGGSYTIASDPPPRAVQPAGSAAVAVARVTRTDGVASDCTMIADAPAPGRGYQGSCIGTAEASSRIIAANDGAVDAAGQYHWYLVWAEVPKSAAAVTFEYQGVREWQVPLAGTACFSVTAPYPAPGTALPVMRAVDASGSVVGEAQVQV